MMAELQPSDQFLVNRDGESYQVTQANLMAQIQDDDLMLVNRDDVSYKITGAEVKDSFVDPVVIVSVQLSTMTPVQGESITAIVVATGGKNPVNSYQWYRKLGGTDSAIVGATDVSYLTTEQDVDYQISCEVTVSDDIGQSVSQRSPYTDPVKETETIDQPTLLTPPNGAGLGPATITPTTDSIQSISNNGQLPQDYSSGWNENAANTLNSFDGNLDTFTAPNGSFGLPAWIAPTPISFTKLEIVYFLNCNEDNGSTNTSMSFKVNSISIASATTAGSGLGTYVPVTQDVTSLVSSPLTNISWSVGANGTWGGLFGVIVDDEILVNNNPNFSTTVVASGDEDIDVLQEGSATMTDASGTVATYTPTSNTITNVVSTGFYNFTANSWSDSSYTIPYDPSSQLYVNDGSTGPAPVYTKVASGMNWGTFKEQVLGNKNLVKIRFNFSGGNNDSTTIGLIKSDGTLNQKAIGTTSGPITVEISDDEIGWYCTISGSATIANVIALDAGEGTSLYLYDNTYTAPADPVLTFSDNQDLTYFKAGDVVQSAYLIGNKPASGSMAPIEKMIGGTKCWVWHFNNPVSGTWYPFAPGENTGTERGDIFPLTIVYSDTTPGAGTSISYSESDCTSGRILELQDVTNIWVSCAQLPTSGGNQAPAPGVGYFELTTNETLYGGSGPSSVGNNPNFTWPSDQTWESLPVGSSVVNINATDEAVKSPYSTQPTVTPIASVVDINIDNNQMTVSGGNWSAYNNSQVWSSNPTGIVSVNAAYGFDNTDAYTSTIDSPVGYYTFNAIDNVTKVVFEKGNANWGLGDFLFADDADGNRYEVQQSSDGVPVTISIPNKSIVKLGGYPSGGGSAEVNLWAKVSVNGRLLLNPSVAPSGENEVTGPAITGTGKIAAGAINTSTNTITVTESNGNWVSSGAWNTTTKQGNAAGTNFYLTGDEVQTITVDPDDVHMTCTAFDGTGDPTYGTTTWQITEDDDIDFATPVVNVTNTNETFYNVSTITPETDPVDSVSGAGTSGDPYVLTLTGNSNLTYFDEGEDVTSIGSGDSEVDAYGLRFDSDKATKLTNTNTSGDKNTWTASFWIKDTFDFEDTDANALIQAGGATADAENIGYNKNGFFWNTSNGQDALQAPNGQSINEWVHAVFQSTDTTFKIYANGTEVANKTISSTLTRYLNATGEERTIGGQPAQEFMNGYLSEYYFVSGQALEPSVFGETNQDNQKWVPKSSTAVKAAIDAAFDTEFPPADYNTSQNWSQYLVSETGSYYQTLIPPNAFDGNLTTECDSEDKDQSLTWTPASGIAYTSSVEVYCPQTSGTAIVNGATQQPITLNSLAWTTLASGSGTITMIKINGDTSNYAALSAIKIDGKILVDNAPFGANGFYLPFDTAATGVNYTQGFQSQATYNIGDTFNGDLTSVGQGGPNYNVWDAPSNIAFSDAEGGVEVYINPASNGGWSYKVNPTDGTSGSSAPSDVSSFVRADQVVSSPGWAKISTGDGTMTSLGMYNTVEGSIYLNGLRVNGIVLVDHNNIGVDDSGNNNDFCDQNFAAGNTSQVWSQMASFSPTISPNNLAFDGNTSTANLVAASDGNLPVTFTLTGVPSGAAVEIKTKSNDNAADIICNGVTISDKSNTEVVTDCGTTSSTTLVITQEITPGATDKDGNRIYYVKVDGKILVDANLQDNVSDSPVKNYAVIANTNANCTTINGNLEMTVAGISSGAGSSIGFDLSSANTSKYYAEFGINSSACNPGVGQMGMTIFPGADDNGAGYFGNYISVNNVKYNDNSVVSITDGDIVGISVTPGDNVSFYTNGSFQLSVPINSTTFPGITSQSLYTFGTGGNASDTTINYGQQPFAAPNVSYNQDTGIATLDSIYNTSQEWSDDVTAAGGNGFDSNNPVTNGFDGNLSSQAINATANQTINIDFSGLGLSGALQVAVAGLGATTAYVIVNGNDATKQQYPSTDGILDFGYVGTINTIEFEPFSGAPNLNFTGIIVNGQILVDSSIFNTSQDWVNTSTFTNVDGSPDTIFDGDTDTGAFNNGSDEASITFGTPIASTSSVQLYVNPGSSPSYISINGGTTTDITGGSAGWYTAASGTNTVTSIQWQDDVGMKLRAVKIDGKILVDPGGGTFETLYENNGTGGTTTVTGTVVVADPTAKTLSLTSADDWSTTEGKKVTGEPGTGLSEDTIYRARVRQTSSNNIVSPFSEINRFKTAGAAPGPVGGGGGLRFDTSRYTELSRTLNDFSQFTFSVWFKWTGESFGTLLTTTSNNNNYIAVADNIITYKNNGNILQWTNITIGKNEWQNLVVSFDRSTSNATAWLNGTSLGAQSSAVLAGSDFTIGLDNSDGFDGYLSEVYFVDNQALGADVFGKSIGNGTWVPKTDTEIKAAINAGPESPYDERANTSQVWSDGVGTVNAFDGSLTTFVPVGNETVITTKNFSIVDTFEIYQMGAGATNSYDVTVNGTTYNAPTPDGAGWITVPVPAGTDVVGGFSVDLTIGNDGIAGVKVDGRLFVDQGVWNVSENWSDGAVVVSGTQSGDPSMAFDGNTSGNGFGSTGTVKCTLPQPLSVTGWTQVIYYGAANPGGTVIFNEGEGDEVTVTINSSATDGQVLASTDSISTLKSVTMVGNKSQSQRISGIRVNASGDTNSDGPLLVDSGAQYNISQTWSDLTTLPASGIEGSNALSNGYDGNINTQFACNNTDDPITLTSTFTGVNKINAKIGGDSSNSGTIKAYDGSGAEIGSATTTSSSNEVEITLSGATVSKIEVSRPGARPGWNYIAINGAILVNPGFGSSGFYLPFDPDATGVNYNTNITATGNNLQAWYNPEQLFNGNLTTGLSGNASGNVSMGLNVIGFSAPAPTGSTVNVYFTVQGDLSQYGSIEMGINGGNTTTTYTSTGGSTGYFTFTPINSNVVSIEATSQRASGGDSNITLAAIEVNGEIVVSHNNIGVDDSGNNNDFFDQNFAVGNTSQVWSSNFTLTGSGTLNQPTVNAFDGNTSTVCETQVSTLCTVTFPAPITNVNSIRVYVKGVFGGNSDFFQINGSSNGGSYYDDLTADTWSTISNPPSTFSSIGWGADGAGSGGTSLNLAAVEVNGVILVDANIQDTVLDTPLTDYAVISPTNVQTTVNNGNLNLTGNQSWYGAITNQGISTNSGTYYFEASVGDTSNFVGLCSGASDFMTTTTPQNSDSVMSQGSIVYCDDGSVMNNSTTRNNYGSPLAAGDVIGVLYNSDTGVVTFSQNSTTYAPVALANVQDPMYPYLITYNPAPKFVSINLGQQPFAYATNNMNGTATVNGEVCQLLHQPITQQTGNGQLFWDTHRQELTTRLQVANRYGILLKDHVSKGIRTLGGALLNRLR